jgi:hypothetical protein
MRLDFLGHKYLMQRVLTMFGLGFHIPNIHFGVLLLSISVVNFWWMDIDIFIPEFIGRIQDKNVAGCWGTCNSGLTRMKFLGRINLMQPMVAMFSSIVFVNLTYIWNTSVEYFSCELQVGRRSVDTGQ